MPDIRIPQDYGSVIASIRQLHQEADQHFPKTYKCLLDKDEWLENVPRTTECFDVSQYFRVLRHISPPPGYELDYDYMCFDGDGAPHLFLRESSRPNMVLKPEELLANLPEPRPRPEFVLDADPNDDNLEEEKRAREREEEEKRKNPLASRLQADGRPESFFELVLFNALAGQFYLAWHGGYNDTRILTNRSEIHSILDQIDSIPELEKQRALKIDAAPKVHFLSEAVAEVSVLMFSQWKGLFRVTEQIARSYPHRFLHTEIEILLEYDCGLRF